MKKKNQLTYAERKIWIQKYSDNKGNTITLSLHHGGLWIVDDGQKFFTTSCSQQAIENTYPVKSIIAKR